jgi:hypothetical protein
MCLATGLSDHEGIVVREVIVGHLEIERGRPLSDASGDIVVGTVAWAEPASEVARLADRHTTEMGADTWRVK